MSLLKRYGTNLNKLAKDGKLDPVFGREIQIDRTIEILCKRGTKKNACLLGESGVGKTAIAQGLAQRIAAGNVPKTFQGKQIVSLNLGLLASEHNYAWKEEYYESLEKLLQEIKQASNIIALIDELHTHLKVTSRYGELSAAKILNPALARGELQCIGASTPDKDTNYGDVFKLHFDVVPVAESTIDETILILNGLREGYETHHSVRYEGDALVAAARLSHAYISDRLLPEKAIDLIDVSGSRVRLQHDQRCFQEARNIGVNDIGEEKKEAGESSQTEIVAERKAGESGQTETEAQSEAGESFWLQFIELSPTEIGVKDIDEEKKEAGESSQTDIGAERKAGESSQTETEAQSEAENSSPIVAEAKSEAGESTCLRYIETGELSPTEIEAKSEAGESFWLQFIELSPTETEATSEAGKSSPIVIEAKNEIRELSPTVSEADIRQVVSTWAGIPVENLRDLEDLDFTDDEYVSADESNSGDESISADEERDEESVSADEERDEESVSAEKQKAEYEKLLNMEKTIHGRIIGQDDAVKAVSRAIRRAKVGLRDPIRPVANFIFCGPTGVGKSELAKAVASCYSGSKEAMVRLDMSEYMERHSVSKLIGSPPGYCDHDDGGQLTEAVTKRPDAVVLFDEIEKAHPDVFNMLLQIMDDGRLTDSSGVTTDFKNTILIMTSNVGSSVIEKGGAYLRINSLVHKELKRHFKPEFLNRLDEIIVYRQLTKPDVRKIADIMLETVVKRLKEKNIDLQMTERFRGRIVDEGYSPSYGARPLRRAITRLLEDNMAEGILLGEISGGSSVVIDVGLDRSSSNCFQSCLITVISHLALAFLGYISTFLALSFKVLVSSLFHYFFPHKKQGDSFVIGRGHI